MSYLIFIHSKPVISVSDTIRTKYGLAYEGSLSFTPAYNCSKSIFMLGSPQIAIIPARPRGYCMYDDTKTKHLNQI